MATAGEVAYGGNIGSGEAQVFQERLNPMLVFGAQQDARRAQQEANKARLQQQAQQKRNADVQKLIDEKIGTPGWFQQENSVNEMNSVSSKAQDFALRNPNADVSIVSAITKEDKSNALRRIAKRNEIQKEIEQVQMEIRNPKTPLDSQWISTQTNKAYDTDVDQLDRGTVIGLKNHPRAYDSEKGIIKSVDDIKNQVNYTGTGEPQDIGFGMQIDGWTKKLRFKTDPNGQIANETVDFVLDSDPSISQRVRWDIARKQAGVEDDSYATPEEMAKIDRAYQAIKFSNDPAIVSQVRGKVRSVLGQLQQSQYIDRMKIQNKPASAANQVTPEDVNARMIKINAVKNGLKELGPGAKPSTKAMNYLAELKGVAKLNGMPVTNIELIPGNVPTNSNPVATPAKLRITMKSGVESGDVLEHVEEVGVNDPRFEEVMNNLWNSTAPVTKEKKITGNSLRGEEMFLDEINDTKSEDEGFLDE